MTEARLRTGLWAAAVIRHANQTGHPAMVLRRGDADAGGVLAVLLGRDGRLSVLGQTRAPDGRPAWIRGTGADPVDQQTADAYIARQVGRDPDLWVLEFDAPDLLPPFEALLI
ncbi:DUF1491 family protein [Gluconacetobacter azotocaptans]|uniref:DUF1491 family protein n=1 Tax=Gluconacetobacter azotocaptans TaxID=142834 RepID=A0A7W4PHW0_9PROT|nr:DUF1491 family protein [Gluconacetobacter azotocaptans]MBB2191521.1 DUF1491 family protein [Gluconacetobacter azotocaptans]MBM9403011.1 DUF1491 family protein [Gluconacetobacter azotocaptans]GBQ28312.1 hypothetical protein AA13594_0944 [Gluconacetobacter azotocaptans DSM 13594]